MRSLLQQYKRYSPKMTLNDVNSLTAASLVQCEILFTLYVLFVRSLNFQMVKLARQSVYAATCLKQNFATYRIV